MADICNKKIKAGLNTTVAKEHICTLPNLNHPAYHYCQFCGFVWMVK